MQIVVTLFYARNMKCLGDVFTQWRKSRYKTLEGSRFTGYHSECVCKGARMCSIRNSCIYLLNLVCS